MTPSSPSSTPNASASTAVVGSTTLIIVILGLASAIGPFAIDMYLPALPQIGQAFQAPVGQVQASLMVFFFAMGAGQLVYGPLSDHIGRKRTLYAGLALFIVSSIACALATDIQTLIAWRFLQGLGSCAGAVVPRAIVRDLSTGPESARMMARLMLVFSVSPILAPLAGSFLIEAWGWRSVFWAVMAAALLTGVLIAARLPETHPHHLRSDDGFAQILVRFRVLLRNGHFIGLVLTGAFCIASFFIYLAGSSFVLMQHYGLSAQQFSIAFAANAMAFIGVSQFSSRWARRWGMAPVVRWAATAHAVLLVGMAAVVLTGHEQLWLMLPLLFMGFACSGMVVPLTSVMALEDHGPIAGTAAALMGTLHMVVGAVVMAAVGRFSDGTPAPMVSGIALASLCTLALARWTLKAQPAKSVTAGTL
jgi:MFS transporter, DHA1 family, multidrug resistance protein